jgi:hypothetical protein
MQLGEAKIGAADLARKLASEVPAKLRQEGKDTRPPCSGGSRSDWNKAVGHVLRELGKPEYDTYPWLLDFVWWSKNPEQMVLAVESELDTSIGAIMDDFQKLPVFKCPLKLLVFAGNANKTKSMAETYLQSLTQHVRGEEYVLVGFTESNPCAFFFKAPNAGKLEQVRFEEISLAPGLY